MLNLTPQEINLFFPVIGMIEFPGGVIVRRGCNIPLGKVRQLKKRGEISMVSRRSLSKLALLVKSTDVKFLSVMTLTYGVNYPLSGKEAKKHLNHFLISAKRHYGNFEYVWCLEFQERGAVHFHIASSLPSPDTFDLLWFANRWQEISTPFSWSYCQVSEVEGRLRWGRLLWTDEAVRAVHSHPMAWEKIRKHGGVGRYFAKYSHKIKQKAVPVWYKDVGRFWGASRGVRMPEGKYFYGTESQVREFVSLSGREIGNWDVLPKVILLG